MVIGMRVSVLDHLGQPVRLGRSLGKGGEGEVFELADFPRFVAKIYHESLPRERAKKLAVMSQLANDEILRIAAWPKAPLFDSSRREVHGIIMPRVDAALPIHELYSPSQRKAHFPKADFRFLIRAARNCAAAFATIHEAGIVIGDVNQGNVLVNQRALVTFIDCDSFQVNANGALYYCTVGVPHFTCPELQSVDLSTVTRTANHDSFGLGILIFHLLFMGRHPFAGRFLGQGDMPIERAISEHRFAYGHGARQRQMLPPPHAIDLAHLPDQMAGMFEQAFTRNSSRPTAQQWAHCLALFEDSLQRCDDDPGHYFPAPLGKCPWCVIVDNGGPNFFVAASVDQMMRLGKRPDIEGVWREILDVPNPRISVLPIRPTLLVRPPHEEITAEALQHHAFQRLVGQIAMVASVLSPIAVFVPPVHWFTIIVAIGFFLWWAILRSVSPLRRIRALRQRVVSETSERLDSLKRSYVNVIEQNELSFQEVHEKLFRLKRDADGLPSQKLADLGALQRSLRERQLVNHLCRYMIADACIPGIGATRVSWLESYGIESAADISAAALDSVPGFGPVFIQKLIEWRRSIESQFRFDSSVGVPKEDLQAVEIKYYKLTVQAERQLRSGLAQLRRLTGGASAEIRRLGQDVERTTANLALAKAAVAAVTV